MCWIDNIHVISNLSHSHNYSMPKFTPCLYLAHPHDYPVPNVHVYLIPMIILCTCSPHPHVYPMFIPCPGLSHVGEFIKKNQNSSHFHVHPIPGFILKCILTLSSHLLMSQKEWSTALWIWQSCIRALFQMTKSITRINSASSEHRLSFHGSWLGF